MSTHTHTCTFVCSVSTPCLHTQQTKTTESRQLERSVAVSSPTKVYHDEGKVKTKKCSILTSKGMRHQCGGQESDLRSTFTFMPLLTKVLWTVEWQIYVIDRSLRFWDSDWIEQGQNVDYKTVWEQEAQGNSYWAWSHDRFWNGHFVHTRRLALDHPKTVGKVPFPIHMMDRKKNRSCQYVIRSRFIPKSEKCSKQRKLV